MTTYEIRSNVDGGFTVVETMVGFCGEFQQAFHFPTVSACMEFIAERQDEETA